jgi:2-oxoacid:acceptor oxidoreductase gamma subunit (pyruvate/2-ketoisovalerate family)
MGPSVFEGLTQDTKIVVNTDKSQEKMRAVLGVQQGELYVLDATSLALKILGRPITNTAMLGAVVRTTEIVALDSILWAVGKRFTGRIGELNLKLIKTAYVEVGKE